MEKEIKVYTAKEVADILQIDVQTVLRYLREGKIQHFKIGTNYRITEKQLKEFTTNKWP